MDLELELKNESLHSKLKGGAKLRGMSPNQVMRCRWCSAELNSLLASSDQQNHVSPLLMGRDGQIGEFFNVVKGVLILQAFYIFLLSTQG
jgi:hypothetical protein